MTIPYYVRKPLDYTNQIYDVSNFDNRPYTHKILEKNNPGLKIYPDGTYGMLDGLLHYIDDSVYPTATAGNVLGLALMPKRRIYFKNAGVNIKPYESSKNSVVTEEVKPVELPEAERNVLFQDEPLDPNVKSVEETKREIEREKAARKRAAYNQARGITTADAYAKQKELRDAGYNVTYDGYWGDASAAEWEKYMKAKMETPSLAADPSVTKPVTTPKATDPNSPEANRQRFLDEQAAKIATAQMPPQFANIDIMGTIKAEEARKKAELEALMQQQGAGSKLLNTDPHNIQGGYVVPKEEPLDYSKLQTHTTNTNPFGFIAADPLRDASKFYLKGGDIKEKPKSISTSGYFLDENGNPVVQNVDMVSGKSKDNKNRWFLRIITQRDSLPADTVMYDFNRRIPTENPDSNAYYNALFEEMLKRSEPINEYKKGGSLKKCSCGCKTLLKRGKGGKVMESKNCK